MAIFLDEQTGPMLKQLLKRELKRLPSNFVADRLLKMVEADDERKQKILTCTHQWNKMTGHKTQCDFCWALQDGYEIWESDSFMREGAPTTHSKEHNNAAPTTPTQPHGSTTP